MNYTCSNCGEKLVIGVDHYCSKKDNSSINNGGSTSYYKLPTDAIDLQDLIEYNNMSWNIANIFKSCYRLGKQKHSNTERDLNKIIWFANRELKRIQKE